jgi:hypothetical protein
VLSQLVKFGAFGDVNQKDFFSAALARTAAGTVNPRQTLVLYQSLVRLPKFRRE